MSDTPVSLPTVTPVLPPGMLQDYAADEFAARQAYARQHPGFNPGVPVVAPMQPVARTAPVDPSNPAEPDLSPQCTFLDQQIGDHALRDYLLCVEFSTCCDDSGQPNEIGRLQVLIEHDEGQRDAVWLLQWTPESKIRQNAAAQGQALTADQSWLATALRIAMAIARVLEGNGNIVAIGPVSIASRQAWEAQGGGRQANQRAQRMLPAGLPGSQGVLTDLPDAPESAAGDFMKDFGGVALQIGQIALPIAATVANVYAPGTGALVQGIGGIGLQAAQQSLQGHAQAQAGPGGPAQAQAAPGPASSFREQATGIVATAAVQQAAQGLQHIAPQGAPPSGSTLAPAPMHQQAMRGPTAPVLTEAPTGGPIQMTAVPTPVAPTATIAPAPRIPTVMPVMPVAQMQET